MTKILVLFVNIVFLCCFSWTAGKLKNVEATKLNCTEEGVSGFCADCLSQIVCSKDQTATAITCPSGQVCQEISGSFSSCVDSLDVPECDCPTSGTTVKADKYDDEKFIVCLDGNPHIQECAAGSTFNSETGNCETPTTTTPLPTTTTNTPKEQCPSGQYDKVAVTCTQYRFCLNDGTTSAIENCNLGEIFNTKTNNCQFYYPFNCTNKANGYYTDTHNCSVYHLCIDGSTYGNENYCKNGEYFDDVNKACAASNVTTCNAIPDCGICPDATTFIKIGCDSYYQCSENTDEATKAQLPYEPVYHECPSGTCFDQTSTYCEFG